MTSQTIKRLQLQRLQIKEELETTERTEHEYVEAATLQIEDKALDPAHKAELSNQTKRAIAVNQLLTADPTYYLVKAKVAELRHDLARMDIEISYQERNFREEIADKTARVIKIYDNCRVSIRADDI